MINWESLVPYTVLMICYVIAALFAIFCYVKNRKYLNQTYNLCIMITYHVAVCISTVFFCIFLYIQALIHYRGILYTASLYIREISYISFLSVSLIFANCIVNYISTRSATKYLKLYNRFGFVIKVITGCFIVVMLITIMFCIYFSYYYDTEFPDAFIAIGFDIAFSVSSFVLTILLVLILYFYNKELNNFPMILQNMKCVMFAVVLGMILQSITRIAFIFLGTLIILGELPKKGSRSIIFYLIDTLRYFLSDVLVIILYTIYFNKNSEHVMIIIEAKIVDENISEHSTFTSNILLEDQLIKLIMKKKEAHDKALKLIDIPK